jgi:hypothetical protein
MTINARRQLIAQSQLRLRALIWYGLGVWAAWNVIQIVAWPHWVEVVNSSSVVATNVKLEVWDQGGKLIAHRRWSKLSPDWTMTVRYSQRKVTAKLSYTLDYGFAEYHERHPKKRWTFRILPNGVVLSRDETADRPIMGIFPVVY